MNAERWQQVKEVLHSASECPPFERAAFVLSACAGDDELRCEVESLLAYESSVENFIEESAFVVAGSIAGSDTAMVGRRIGAYRIVREIGRGGMGAVYLGVRDDDEYQKQVAIKLIKRGMDTDAIVRRFRNERQILAGLEHPNIARLIDGGTTEDGLPYLIMEYVEGVPVDRYCDANKLSIAERLRLFRRICAAIQFAHQNLIVHRDLKPSNILVTPDGTPKLLDFGIAKLMQAEVGGGVVREQTATGLLMMTPEYASPEQISGTRLTTASDVYSLGVVLYELLTGRRSHRFTSRRPDRVAQIICDTLPERPSLAVCREVEAHEEAGDDENCETRTTGKISEMRGETSAERLRKRLRGDLDNIVLVALRKDPARRYASVEQFSEDVRRHLEGLPVHARADTISYRATKFIKRNRIGVAAATLVFVTLLGGVIATAWQARVARTERARAEQRFNDVRKLANSFIFEFSDPINELPNSTLIRHRMVERALEYLDGLAPESGSDPSLQHEIALAYIKVGDIQGKPNMANLGDTQGAIKSYRRAVEILQPLNASDPSNLENMRVTSLAYQSLGYILRFTNDYAAALENLRQSLNLREALSGAEPSNIKYRHLVAESYKFIADDMTDAAIITGAPAELSAALENYRKAAAIYQETLALNPQDINQIRGNASIHQRIGSCLILIGDNGGDRENYRQAIEHHTQAIALWQTSTNDPAEANGRFPSGERLHIGMAQTGLGDLNDAFANFDKAGRVFEKLVVSDPNNVEYRWELVYLYQNTAKALARAERTAEAITNYSRAVQLTESLLAADQTRTVDAYVSLVENYQSLAELLEKRGDAAEALKNYRKEIEIGEQWLTIAPSNTALRAKLDEARLRLDKDLLTPPVEH